MDGSNVARSSDPPDRAAHEQGPRRQGRPAPGDRAATRAAIVDAAIRLFSSLPFPDVTMDDVAREVGVSERAVLHKFPTKRDLFRAAAGHAVDRFTVEIAERVLVHADVRRRINALLDLYLHFYADDPDLLSFVAAVNVDANVDQRRPARPGAALVAAGDQGVPLNDDIQQVLGGIDVFIGLLVDNAVERGEIHAEADRDALQKLLRMIAVGLALATADPRGDFPNMVEEFRRIVDGTMFLP